MESDFECRECGDSSTENRIGKYCCYGCWISYSRAWQRWYDWTQEHPNATDEDFEDYIFEVHGMTWQELRERIN